MSRPRILPKRKNTLAQSVQGETILLDRQNGFIHRLNATASFIWSRCHGDRNTSEIARDLAGEFDVDRITAERDVAVVIDRLSAIGVLELCQQDS